MKKSLSLFIAILLLVSLPLNVFALSETNDISTNNVITFEDGSYIIISIENAAKARASTVIGSKTAKYFDSDDELQWSATLSGTFSYTGSSATCTSSSITYSIDKSTWKISSATASRSGNKATGNVIAKYHVLGIPIKTVETAIAITCSASGVLS